MSSTATSADLTEVGRTQDQLTHSSSPHATGSCVESRHGEGSAAPRQPLPEGLVVEDQWSRDQELRSNIVSLANAVQRLSSEIEKLSSQRSSTQLCPRTSVVGPEGVVVDEESGVIDSSLSIGTSNDRDHNTEALTAFWNAQSPSDEKLVELRNVFIDVVYGPRRDIKGIRDCFDPSINDDNSPTFLVFRETDEKAGTIWRSVSWEPVEVEDDNPDTWDKFSKEISNNIKEKWLYSFGGKARAGSPQDPTHFSDGWDHFQGASVILTELSYNEQCFPKRVHSKSWQGGAFISEKSLKAVDSSPVQLQPTWGKKIFGKSWRVSFEDTVLNFTLLAFILSQVTLGYNIDTEDIGFCGAVFAKRYAGPWPSTKWARWCCFGNDNRICHLQFHIRYISTSNTAIARLIPEVLSEGLHFHREKGQAFSLGAGQDFPLVESRVAIAINTSLDSKFAHYSMVTLTDSDKLSLDDFEGNQAWSDINFSLCGKFAGVAVFQVAIRRLLMVWGRRWNFVLDSINNLLKVQV
ncbi:hypothetical protein BKA61DRAFT_310465 [Leptodontidium sp. MPI-SDFR-AT-0119]|nr:hypothetical protein BKA61DRAFT_310465 [Leptodontidium sp. MPI-SDFR-AT-0119]